MKLYAHKRKLISLSVFILVMFSASLCLSATYYVDCKMPNNTGDGLTPETAKRDIMGALFMLCNKQGGDTVIIMDGVYAGERNKIQQSLLFPKAITYTTIKAKNRWGVEMKEPLSCNDDRSGRNFVHLDGLRFTTLAEHSFNGSNWKITNCAFYGSLGMGNSFQERSGIHSNNILIEDCHIWGQGGVNSYRYKVSTQSCSNVIFRRVVARHDGGYTSPGYENPSAVFMVYSSEHVRLQNCVAIDSPGQPNQFWSAAFYTADHQSNAELYFQDVKWEGCISMNVVDCMAFNLDNNHDFNGYDTVYDNCAVIGNSTYGFYSNSKVRTKDKIIYNQCTAINMSGDGFGSAERGEYYKMVQYSIMQNLKGQAIGNSIDITLYNNAYGCRKNNPGRDSFSMDSKKYDMIYPVRIEPGSKLSTAGRGTRVGADITRAWGESGSMWGESGFDKVTSDSLWPFPNEEQIKKDFASIDNGSNTKRGFCADGTTLTKYIWEYLGNPIPPEIYGGESGVGSRELRVGSMGQEEKK